MRYRSPEHCAKISKALKGKKFSEERLANLKKIRGTPEYRTKISKALKGRKLSAEWKAKISKAHTGIKVAATTGEKHWHFLDVSKIGASGIHQWIRKRKTKPSLCENCGLERKLELSSKDHKYSRDPDDYRYFCRSCHRKWDTEHNGFTNFFKANAARWPAPTSESKTSC